MPTAPSICFKTAGAVEMQMAEVSTTSVERVTIDAVWTLDAPVDKDSWEFVGGYLQTVQVQNAVMMLMHRVYSVLGQNSGSEFLENLATIESEGKFPKELRKEHRN